MSKYDDASWHYGGDFPSDLAEENASTHIGMFLGWIIKRGLESDYLNEIAPDGLEKVRAKEITAAEFLRSYLDGKLTDEDLNDAANEFAKAYYEGYYKDNDYEADYIADYDVTFGRDLPSLYHVEDSLMNAALIEYVLDQRFDEFRNRIV